MPQDDLFSDSKGATMRRPAKKLTRRGVRAPRVTIHVKDKEINEAMEKHSSHCMIAEAIKREVPSASSVSVDVQTIRWSEKEKGLRYTYLTPRDAVVSILKFDNGIKPKPFQIRLRGAQITSMHQGSAGNQKKVHKLGKKKLQATNGEKKKGLIPEIIGGQPPPKGSRYGRRREFGMRGIGVPDIIDDAT